LRERRESARSVSGRLEPPPARLAAAQKAVMNRPRSSDHARSGRQSAPGLLWTEAGTACVFH